MKNSLNVFLVSGLLYLSVGCSAKSNVMSEPIPHTTDTVESTGVIYKEAFVNKGGRKIDGVYTWYFKTGDKSYFIKSCEGNTTSPKFVECHGKKVKVTASFRKGLWDVCDGNPNVQSRVGEYVAIFTLEVIGDANTYTYADGSGNAYELTSDSLEYIPVKKEHSSSGMYSGGDPAKVKVSKEQFDVIATMMRGIVADKSNHIENREKTTGAIWITYEKESTQVYFRKGDRMTLLENTLKFVLKK